MPPFRLNETVETGIHAWAVAALAGTGVTEVIWDKQDAQQPTRGRRPALPFVTLNISSGPRREGTSETRFKSLDTFTYSFRQVFTLSVQTFAKTNHMGLISTLINSLELETKRSILRQAGVAVRNILDPLDTSEFLETGFELRGSVDIVMAFNDQVDDVVGEIQKVHVTGSVDGQTIDETIP